MGCFGSKPQAKEPVKQATTESRQSKPAAAPSKPVHVPEKPAESSVKSPEVPAAIPQRRRSPPSTPFSPNLPIVSSTSLTVYDCQRRVWAAPVTFKRRIAVSDGSVWLLLSDQSVLLLDGGSSDCREINSVTGEVSPFCQLTEPRAHSGAVSYEKTAYIFGGCVAPTAEKLQIATRMPTSLSNMLNSRSKFTPCLYGDSVFLCGGLTITAEIYEIPSNSYRFCGFSIPEIGDTISVLSKSSIVIVTSEFISHWDTCAEEFTVQGRGQKSDCWGSTSAVCSGDCVFVAVEGEVVRVDLKTTGYTIVGKNALPEILG